MERRAPTRGSRDQRAEASLILGTSRLARGLAGVQLVISDAHEGLKAAIGSVFIGATWQRCTHRAA